MTACNGELISPWRVGARAAKKNIIPALTLQAVCLCLLLSYYYVPAVEGVLRPVSEWQRVYGVPAAFVSRGIFGGVLPGVFMLAMPTLRMRRPVLSVVMSFFFWGMMGSLGLGLYRLQALTFGTGHDMATLIKKMLVDQSAFTVLVAVPLSATFHLWEHHGFSFAETRAHFPKQWVRRLILPTLLPNWVVWAPSMIILYALPETLQVHFSGLVGCFWSLICMQVAVHATDRAR